MTSPEEKTITSEDVPKKLEEEKPQETNEDNFGEKMTAGANYIGSIFNSAWAKTSALSKVAAASFPPKEEENKPEMKPETGSETPSEPQKDEQQAEKLEDGEEKLDREIDETPASFLTSAWTKVGDLTRSASANFKETEAQIVGNFSHIVEKVANDATNVIKERVNDINLISEFNKEQDEFIKSKQASSLENGLAPWIGYQDEKALKAKILLLSEDKRNFVRSPPTGVTFDFDYKSISSTAMALLTEDPNLKKMRYNLVPKVVKEDAFWRNYFYRVTLIKQSFDLKDLEEKKPKNETKPQEADRVPVQDEDVNQVASPDADDEFVSESYQASSKDIDEANESMKRLGVKGGKPEEWEAELEGELNEFEVLNSKEGSEDTNDPEWENQIQEMLDAEDQKN